MPGLEQTEVLQQILDNQCTAVVLLDPDHKVRFLNTAAELLFARSGDRIEGFALSDLFDDLTEDNVFDLIRRPNSPFTQREARWRLPNDPEPITVDYMVSPMVMENESWRLLEIQHIDRLKRISRDEEVMAKHETTRHLVRGVAHEIKNPLGGIRGAAQLLARELPNEDLQDYTSVIIEEADRLRNLVDRMLGSSKLPTREATNIHHVLERVYNLVKVETGRKVRIVLDYDPSIPDFPADQEQLIQALLNIVRNAMEALLESENGGGQIILKTRIIRQMTIGYKRHKLVSKTEIIDNGPGIPPEMLGNIFYPMISGRANGTGLGLSIAQQIVNQHNGMIECSSQPGETRFGVLIPLGDNE